MPAKQSLAEGLILTSIVISSIIFAVSWFIPCGLPWDGFIFSPFEVSRYVEFLHLKDTWKVYGCHTPKVVFRGVNF
jgi:hypothetical protein